MIARFHQLKDMSKLLEVMPLLCFQRVLEKERDDDLEQLLPTSHSIGHSFAVVGSHHATSEE